MEQLEFFQVPSPCVGVCTVDDRGYCRGCMRKREERFRWLEMTPAEQLHVIQLCRQRYRRKVLAARKAAEAEIEPHNPQQELF
ncbi:DUF1289 domain-containing protein [Vibrio fluvialis]|uniref:DUF1289 domain-containing protein n=1 Tax=Vibrio fluvialis TaxID=676 RepID=UPI0005CA45DD|nr:DUF1289 domain-containing protein [Vibrio fluvialis]AVH32899.1 DUF1289 domain-containing protein [Vibrio fluvialis]EKO3534468.1 DUF1289 domain-containing protein [Vibrio fluvialis]EKO3537997.1 DUF1289 domain-containing protein [Vibrio fluvialis]EKO3992631.1 DUF1289 domain-containing protein [Vibrio fluvialis]TOY93884.1 DUF1289 domain-containing protein [Vibrio fluvialis]